MSLRPALRLVPLAVACLHTVAILATYRAVVTYPADLPDDPNYLWFFFIAIDFPISVLIEIAALVVEPFLTDLTLRQTAFVMAVTYGIAGALQWYFVAWFLLRRHLLKQQGM